MAIRMEAAVRSQAKIKMAFSGPSGSGKTLSALLLGYGLVKAANPTLSEADIWRKICVIDTENKSASLYERHRVGSFTVGTFNKINLSAPFSPQNYMEAIEVAERGGIEFLIIDSLSHAWQGEGGMLDIQGAVTKRVGNTYTAWREVTPLHNRLVDRIMQCEMHVCMNMRSKTEYVIEDDDRGRKVPRKVGMAPVFRDGIEFETTLFFEVTQDHSVNASKDRTGLFDGQYFVVTPETGKKIWGWLSTASAEDVAPPQMPAMAPADAKEADDRVNQGEDTAQKQTQGRGVSVPEIDPATMSFGELMKEVTDIYDSVKDGLSPGDKRALSNNIKTVTKSSSANFKALSEDKIEELRELVKVFRNLSK